MSEEAVAQNQDIPKPKKFKPSAGVIERVLVSILARDPEPLIRQHCGPFPYRLEIMRDLRRQGNPAILLVEKNTATMISSEDAAGLLRSYVKDLTGKVADFNVPYTTCLRAVESWLRECHTPEHFRLPPILGFQSEPEVVMTRLPFDPIKIETMEELYHAAPMFHDMLKRVAVNSDALCMRIGSIFDPDCDRKQALWMYGPPDCGKSQWIWLIQQLCGNTSTNLGAKDTHSSHWKWSLVGKRLAIVQEAAPTFLRSCEFKSLTGDLWHLVNPKNKPQINIELPLLFFFMSNDAPAVPKDESLLVRIIDCRMESVPEEDRLPEAQFRGMLTKELPYIAGYCLARYQSLGTSGRLPVERAELEDLAERYDGDYLTVLQRLYIDDENGRVIRDDFKLDLINEGFRDGRDLEAAKRVLLAHFPVTEKRLTADSGRRVRAYIGIRRRREDERVLANLKDDCGAAYEA